MTERLHFHFHFHALEKAMATHSSVLAWRIPGMAEPGQLRPGTAKNNFFKKRLFQGSASYIPHRPNIAPNYEWFSHFCNGWENSQRIISFCDTKKFMKFKFWCE